nr:hypothetical protein [Tanacetum cinerariifolium]
MENYKNERSCVPDNPSLAEIKMAYGEFIGEMPPRQSNHVNNEADPAFTFAVAQAVVDLLPTLTARITDEIRQNKNNGNNASTPVEAENWIAHIEKIFEVLGCDDQFKARLATYKLEGDAHSWWIAYKQAKGGDAYVAMLSWNDFRDIFFLQLVGFLGAKAGTQEEQAKHFKWGLNDFVLDRILNTELTDVAQETTRGTETAIVYDHQKHHHRGLIREPMIEGIVINMATVADMATRIDMALTDGVVIDRAVTDMVTDMEMVVRSRGVTKMQVRGQHYSRSYGSSSQSGYP